MLATIYWILAILVMSILIVIAIYDLVNNIKNQRDLEKYKKKQWETLNKLIEREENK